MRRLLALLVSLVCSAPFSITQAQEHPPLALVYSAYHPGGDTYGGDVYLYDFVQGSHFRLTKPNRRAESYPVVAPDGHHLAWTSGSGTAHELTVAQINSRFQVRGEVYLTWNDSVTQWGSWVWSPVYTESTIQLAFTTNFARDLPLHKRSYMDVWVVDVPRRKWQPRELINEVSPVSSPLAAEINATRRRLTRGLWVEDIAWSPDGTRMAIVTTIDKRHGLYTLDTSGVNADIRFVVGSERGIAQPTWSPDGQWIAYVVGRNHYYSPNPDIYVINANGGEPRPLIATGLNETMPAWSPDGQWIAFMSRGWVTLIRPDGSDVLTLFRARSVSWACQCVYADQDW